MRRGHRDRYRYRDRHRLGLGRLGRPSQVQSQTLAARQA